MNVSLTIMEDADGVFSVAYCGRDCSSAMEALTDAIATGKFVKGGVVRSPEAIKTRVYSHQESAPPAPAAPSKGWAAEAAKAKK